MGQHRRLPQQAPAWRVKFHRVLFIATLLGCARENEPPPEPVATASFEAADTSPRIREFSCPHTGLWSECTLGRRLKQAGFVVKRSEEKARKRAGFSVEPVVYSLGSSRLEVFIYKDESSLAKDIALIDTVTVSPRGTPPAWESTPILIRSGNLAAVLLTQNPRQAERAMLAITAGAPQPGSPR